MSAYYNEIDPKAAATLRELIAEGLIAPGDVDERSVEDVLPSEIAGYTQVHLFAGFGIWSLAFRMAGWPDSRPVWSASFPCQPFSAAGKGGGFADDRHLWPAGFWLLQHGKGTGVPIYGEQVASPDGLTWLDLVRADLETIDHAVWSVVLASAGFGAPIIRQRSYWLARANGEQHDGRGDIWQRRRSASSDRRPTDGMGSSNSSISQQPEGEGTRPDKANGSRSCSEPDRSGYARGLGSSSSQRCERGPDSQRCALEGATERREDLSDYQRLCNARRLAVGDSQRGCGGESGREDATDVGEPMQDGRLAQASRDGHDRSQRLETEPHSDGSHGRLSDGSDTTRRMAGTDGGSSSDGDLQRVGELGQWQKDTSAGDSACWPGPTNGFWRDADWLRCRDDKWRPVEPGTFPLAHGYPERMGILRGAGNAISPQVAAAWISVTM